jgi:hypothetical protein
MATGATGDYSPGVKRQGCAANRSLPSSAEVQNNGLILSLSHTSSWYGVSLNHQTLTEIEYSVFEGRSHTKLVSSKVNRFYSTMQVSGNIFPLRDELK